MPRKHEQRLSALEARMQPTHASSIEDARAELLAALEQVCGQPVTEPQSELTDTQLAFSHALEATYG